MEMKRTPLRVPTAEEKEKMAAVMAARRRELDARLAALPEIRLEGVAALRRLLPIAQRDHGASSVVARFLLNLYNGDRFPFDNTELRRLDYDVFDDCMAVLKMDFQPQREVHGYFDNGGAIWEKLAADWNIKDYAGKNWR